MKSFLTNLFFFLSCGLGSGCTETFTYPKVGLSEILNNRIKRFTKGTEQLLRKNMGCATDEECQSYILGSKCISSFCECTLGTILSSDSSKCLPTATEYGSDCEDNAQCSYLLSAGGVCTDNKCTCKNGYHYLKGNCWKNIDLHEKCFRDEQCFSAYEYVGLKCEKNVCRCRENYYERMNSSCRLKRKANESCNLDDDCADQNTCENMICSNSAVQGETESGSSDFTFKKTGKNINCSKGMFELNNLCVRELGMNCTNDSDCNHITKAFCLDGSICACQHVLYVASEDNRECLRVSRGNVDDIQRTSCKKDPQCGIFGGNSFCQNKRCRCKDGTYFEKEKKFCWTIKSLNEICFDNKDCYPSATHAECRETKSGKLCVCQNGYHSKGSHCFLDALEVGDLCSSDEDCLFPNSSCNDSNTCVCKENYYPENGKCKLGVGAPGCDTDTDCAHLENTECKNEQENLPIKRCLCLENHTSSDDYKYCLPVANFKEKCKESFQCKFPMGDVGMCKYNVCECREGEHYSNGKCYKSKFIKESCSSQSECFPGNDNNSVICLKGYCFCNYDYKLDENGICVKTNSATNMRGHSMSLVFILFLLTLRK